MAHPDRTHFLASLSSDFKKIKKINKTKTQNKQTNKKNGMS